MDGNTEEEWNLNKRFQHTGFLESADRDRCRNQEAGSFEVT